MADISANDLLDRHNITQADAQFRLPPTIQQMRGNRGEALLFTQMADTSGRQPGNTNGSAGHGQCEAKEPLLPRCEVPVDLSRPLQRQEPGRAGGGGAPGDADNLKGRKKIIRRARKHPTVDRIITFLQDKQVDDDHQDLIQDLQLPLLRKILNVIFIALGVVFLLGVIVVIIYTNIGKDDHNRRT